ncbi:MAG: exodeoxyribonuclease VII large subunit [Ruminococcaceae bacterium]|nr:exodeoxyribonuclease VII large subunit [Oscillospiraceae bacterium]
MQNAILTVTDLNEYLKMLMDGNPLLTNLYVKGEISNFTNHYKTGHFYFSLKDEGGAVRGVMFRSYAQRLAFLPENGMKVIVHGRVSVFPRDGQYQIYVDDMQPDGIGALWIAYEQLRRRLEAEGLFDPARKRPLPPYPETVGVITSPTGAAVRDVMHILGRRYPLARVVLYPALVQGAGAAPSLVAGVRYFNEQRPVDVIILGRGGGSTEDLWAFNDEALARTVAASRIPVISAVGHETDVTICDFVADMRAPTPSAAAELAVPDQLELRAALNATEARLAATVRHRLETERKRVAALREARVLRMPRVYFEDLRMQLSYLAERLQRASEAGVTAKRHALGAVAAKLEALNPLGVLSRGYTAVLDDEGHAVTRCASLSSGQRVQIRFCDGAADARIIDGKERE